MSVTRIARRRGFTLVELLVVCAVIAVLLSMVLFALRGAAEQARVDRTRAQINKINDLLMTRYEGYRQRPLPYRIPAGTPPQTAALTKLQVTWELMRMELPERIADVRDPSGMYGLQPSLWKAYRRKLMALTGSAAADPTASWTDRYSNAECLYLILSTIRDGESTGLDFFSASEIADLDGDNVPEILDGWGRPIAFFRWAPGYTANDATYPINGTLQSGDATVQPDPFDPFGLYKTQNHFALFPLVFSAGPDGRIATDGSGNEYVWGYGLYPGSIQYASTSMSPPKDPWFTMGMGNGPPIGQGQLEDGYRTWEDNITNHLQVVR